MKKYRKTGAALLAAALLCTGGAAQAAELTVTSPEDLSVENGWNQYNGSIWAPTQDISGNVVIIGSGGTSPDLGDRWISGGYSDTDAVSGNRVTMESGTVDGLYGGKGGKSVKGNTVEISGKETTVKGGVYGGFSTSNDSNVIENSVIISGGTVNADVYGGYSDGGGATGNTVTISGGTVNANVYGGHNGGDYWGGVSVSDNTVTLSGTADVSGAQLYGGGYYYGGSTITGNTLVVDNWSGGENGTTVGGLHNFESIRFTHLAVGKNTELNIAEGGIVAGMNGVTVFIDSIGAGDCKGGETYQNTLTWNDPLKSNVTKVEIASNLKNGQLGWISTDRAEGGLYVNQISYVNVAKDDQNASQVNISATVENSALTGKFIDSAGQAEDASRPLVIGDDFTTNVDTVAGAYAVDGQAASGGQLYITGTPAEGFTKTIYAGYSHYGEATDNTVYVGWDGSTVKAAQASGLSVYGSDKENGTNNTLHVYGNGNTLGSIGQFNTLAFDNVTLNDSTAALSVTDADLTGASVSLNSLKGGTAY